jgi:phosphoribosylglycinamide formyltransferase-1
MAYVVLVSGAGSNLDALIKAGVGEIGAVVADVQCPAIEKATAAGIPTAIVAHDGGRERFTRAILKVVDGADALVLAGFMRILGREAMARFPNKIVNIHPSLLPAFPGLDPIPRALAAGVKLTGVTVHFVDEEVDHGPIIAQRSVSILPDDDADSLRVRIQREEHDLYPQVVAALLGGRLQVDGRVVRWS